VKSGLSGRWVQANAVKGLFVESAGGVVPPAVPKAEPREPGRWQPAVSSAVMPVAASADATRPCPYCGETILRVAKKCKHCGEFLDEGCPEGGHQVKTNVKQGALVGAVVCLAAGALFMLFSRWLFVVYSPLFFAAFILSIAAMAQGRVPPCQ
jgi:hypothetical protein